MNSIDFIDSMRASVRLFPDFALLYPVTRAGYTTISNMTPEGLGRISDDAAASALRNKQRAFLECLLPIKAQLSGYCRAMTAKSGLAEATERARDLMSETILKAYENFDRIHRRESFAAYLFTIAHRELRKERKRRTREAAWDDKLTQTLSAPGTQFDERADLELLHSALGQLPDKTREALVLFEIGGLSLEEVREVQGGTLSGVKSRLVRGREELRKMLSDNPQPVTSTTSEYRSNSFRRAQSPLPIFAMQAKEKL